jgi:hypothetical protein
MPECGETHRREKEKSLDYENHRDFPEKSRGN